MLVTNTFVTFTKPGHWIRFVCHRTLDLVSLLQVGKYINWGEDLENHS